jgi:hypothetical protein
LSPNKLERDNVRGKATIPGTRSLLETIKRLDQMTDIIRMCRINKPGRLLTINCLYKSTMQESILPIELMHWPVTRQCH